MKAIYIRVGKPAVVIDIQDDYRKMREAIACDCISFAYPFEDNAAIVCDDEGKLYGKKYSVVLSYNGEAYDTINGDCLIVGTDINSGRCVSLTAEQIEKYLHQYRMPQVVVKMPNGQYVAKSVSEAYWNACFN